MISGKELAEKLGVSAATISMVFNNKPGISEETRFRVIEAARRYGYVYKPRGSQDSPFFNPRIICFVVFKKHGLVVGDTPFFTEVMEGILQACGDAGYQAKVAYHYADMDFRVQAERNEYRQCAGLILLGTEMNTDDLSQFLGINLPTVVLDAYFEEISADYVLINNVQGAFLATKYLAQQGHTSVGYLRSSIRISNFSERANGYYNALRKHGIDTLHPHVIEISPQMEQGYEDMVRYLDSKPPLATAYFADNDIIASAAVRGFARFGYRVPEDISVIGFDDMPFCQLMMPPLSTMRVPKHILGSTAVKRLAEMLRGGAPEHMKISVATELTQRCSVNQIVPENQ